MPSGVPRRSLGAAAARAAAPLARRAKRLAVPDDPINTDHYGQVVAAYNTIIDHPLFETAFDADPLPIQVGPDSGVEAG